MLNGAARFSIASAVLILTLSGCIRAAGALFVADPYLPESTSNPLSFRDKAVSTAGSSGVSLRPLILDSKDTLIEDAEAAVGKSNAGLIILSPLFYDQLETFLKLFPEKVFMIPGTYASAHLPEDEALAARSIIAVFDRVATYERAGELFARKIRREKDSSPGSERGAAALFYTGTVSRRHEMDAFLEGYRKDGEPVPLQVHEISSLRRQEEVQSAVDVSLDGEAGFIFLSLSSLNATAMNRLAGTGVFIAAEHAVAGRQDEKRILFSIQDDFFKALSKGIESYTRGRKGIITVEPDIVETGVVPVFPGVDTEAEANGTGS